MTARPDDLTVMEPRFRQLYARYVDAVCRRDVASFADCFSANAIWKIAGLEIVGRDAISVAFGTFMAMYRCVFMTMATPLLDFNGETWTGRSQFTEHNFFNDGRRALTLGTYWDCFSTKCNSTTFARRHAEIHYMGPADLSGKLFEIANFGPPPAGPAPDRAAMPRLADLI